MPKYGFQLCNESDAKRHPQNAIAEQKYDGTHVIAEGGRLYNRKGRDITEQFPEVQVHPSLVLVGDLVVLDHGVSDFNKLLLRKTDKRKEIVVDIDLEGEEWTPNPSGARSLKRSVSDVA